MRYKILILIMLITYQSCIHSVGDKKRKSANLNTYIYTVYQNKFDPAAKAFKPDNLIDTVTAENDTVAYLNALKTFYSRKITERKTFNYGEPKSFLIVDTKGIDIKVKLSDKIVKGLNNQVLNQPEVQQMIEAYKKDSL